MPNLPAIDNGVPLPERGTVLSYGNRVPLVDTLRKLQAGQSFVVDTVKARIATLDTAHRLGIKVTTKRQEDGRYRIWRKE